MEHPAIIFWTLLATAVFGVAARFLRQPYPIVMVLGGVLLALLPQLPTITMRPMTVFFVLLPALLFGAAWRTDFGEFKEFLGPIVMLALGLVVLTTVAVALGAHWLIGIPISLACSITWPSRSLLLTRWSLGEATFASLPAGRMSGANSPAW